MIILQSSAFIVELSKDTETTVASMVDKSCRITVTVTSPNRWRFSGKESQSFLNASIPLLDFGARLYNPTIARWTTSDPLSEKYHGISPYAYCLGNPIVNIDLQGDEVSLIGIDDAQRQGTTQFGTGDLLKDLVEYVRAGNDCRLIMIGDSAQLPPVGMDASPALAKEYMDGFGGVCYSSLTEVVRQQKESGILFNATKLRELIASDLYGDGMYTPDELGLTVDGFDDIVRITGGELIDTLNSAYFSEYSKDDAVVLCRSNKRANRYNAGIRAQVFYDEERLVRGEKLMIVKNCYQFLKGVKCMDYIANGDIAKLVSIKNFEERYGLHFADARLSFPDYDDTEIVAKVCLDTLESESASLSYEQQNQLYNGVNADYADIPTKKKRYEAVREDPYYNALQLKYANAITCHKSQGGQWSCVFIDNPFWQDELTTDDLKWLYTAITRATDKVYLVNFKDEYFASV